MNILSAGLLGLKANFKKSSNVFALLLTFHYHFKRKFHFLMDVLTPEMDVEFYMLNFSRLVYLT